MYQMEREIAKLQEEAELPRKMERREEIIKSFDELIENIRRVRTHAILPSYITKLYNLATNAILR